MGSISTAPLQGDENRQGGIYATTITATVIATIVVAMRMTTRIWIVQSVGWDDYTVLAATLGIIIGCGLVIVEIHYGFGKHSFYLSTWQFIEFQKYSYGEWMQTFQTLMLTKISICLFLLRIPVESRFIRPLQGTIILLIVSNVILTVLWVVQCRPLAAAWNTNIQARCFSQSDLRRIIFAQALISIISDFVLASFPVFILWRVQISVRVKAGLCALMSLGLITAACCIVRTVLNWQNVTEDPTWTSVDNWHWRSWEVCIGIVATSIPALRPGYKFLTNTMSAYRSKRSSRKASNALLKDSPPSQVQDQLNGPSAVTITKYSNATLKQDVIDDKKGLDRNVILLQNLPFESTIRSVGADTGRSSTWDNEEGRKVAEMI